jgi:hypothetical protein
MSGGVALLDYDGDGWLDLLTTGGGVASELWQNSGGTLDHSPLEPDLAVSRAIVTHFRVAEELGPYVVMRRAADGS